MGKALVIAEKPSVASDIAKVLGGCEDHDGYFENDTHVITFAVGHLYELLSPEEVDEKFKRWVLENLPILPETFRYKPKRGQSERIRTIRKLIERDDIDELVNACDAGREGELIFREISGQIGLGKPIRRLWLQSMTDNAIREGFQNLRPGEEFDGLAKAAACRANSDWLIGMNATRAITKRLKTRKEKGAWSAGRVQTPTLAMLVDREFIVLAHVPRPYWRVSARFLHGTHPYSGTWFDPSFKAGDDDQLRDDRIFDEERANAIVAAVASLAGTAEETRKPSRESAPPLFDLTSLQREGNRRFGWSARRTLSAAQRCYDRHKLLTYPRTGSRCLPEDYRATVNEVLSSLAGGASHPSEEFAQFAESAQRLQRDGLVNEAKVFNDAGVTDHFAIIPTGTLPAEPLTGDDKRLFDLVTRRFLGAFHPPAVWERVERVTEVAGEHFRSRARSIKQPGWRAVLAPATEEVVPDFLLPLGAEGENAKGAAIRNETAEIESEETRPPPRITEARLLSLMENAGRQIEDEDLAAVLHDKGIGTPATRADVIENLIAKGYVVRVDKALRPSVKGIRLIDTLRRIRIDRLASPALTGELESHLLEVERGGRSDSQFMAEMKTYATEIVERAKTFEYEELYDLNDSMGPCPSCGKPVVEYAWFYRCQPEPDVSKEDDCPMRFWKDTSGRYIDRDAVRALLANGTGRPLDGFTSRNGRTYKGILEIDKEKWQVKVRSLGWNEGEGVSDQPDYDVDPEPLGPCPFEEQCSVIESPNLFVCQRTVAEEESSKSEDGPKSCGFVFPRTVCKREITRDEALVYLRSGKTELLTDFTSRFGRPFSATLVLKENGRHGFEFQPRKSAAGGGKKKTTPKKATKKKTTKKKTTKKKTKAARKKTSGGRKAAAKKSGTKAARKKAARKKPAASEKKVAEAASKPE